VEVELDEQDLVGLPAEAERLGRHMLRDHVVYDRAAFRTYLLAHDALEQIHVTRETDLDMLGRKTATVCDLLAKVRMRRKTEADLLPDQANEEP
jgi:hypothetical protein